MRLLIAAVLLGCIVMTLGAGKYQARWKKFRQRQGKLYDAETEKIRSEIYEKNIESIDQHNEAFVEGKVNYYVDEQEFSDLTKEEILQQKTGFKPAELRISKRGALTPTVYAFGPNRPTFRFFNASGNVTIPSQIDWTIPTSTVNWTEPVHDQKTCGCCWAFATATVVSAQLAIKKKVNVVLSQQELIDCSKLYTTNGCNGASQANALEYFITHGAILQSQYPYTNAEGVCKSALKSSLTSYKITGFYQIVPTHDALLEALVSIGPVTVSVHVESGFMNYKGGIYEGKNANGTLECNEAGINHAVTLVGYGTDAKTGLNFWKIKNTWGTSWGEGGYIRMLRSKTFNTCGIFKYTYVPILA